MVYKFKYICKLCFVPREIIFDTERTGQEPTQSDLPDSILCGWRGCKGRAVNVYNKDEDAPSNHLVEHAKRELTLINESDEEFKECILDVIKAFSSYRHSGGSASVAIPMINTLLQFKNLVPLTNDPKEWINVGPKAWLSSRNSEAFSSDAGQTYYLLSENKNDDEVKIHTSDPMKEQ